MKTSKPVRLVVGLLAFSSALAACREPTEITLQVHTNLPCDNRDNWRGVAIYVGKPGPELEQAAPTLVSDACEPNGRIGSLVVVPSGSHSDELGVRVVAGLASRPEACAARGFQGCVVARRALRFTPYAPLELDIALEADCVNIGCDATHTCLTGGCVGSAQIEMPHPEDVREPSVRCGDNGVRCGLSGKVCCLTVDTAAQTTSGECRYPETCEGIVLNCDDDTDCPRDAEQNLPRICMLAYDDPTGSVQTPGKVSLSECRLATNVPTFQGAGLALCEKSQPCADGRFACGPSKGDPNPLPGYQWCEYQF